MLSLQNSKEKLSFTKDTHIIHLFLTLMYELIPSLLKTLLDSVCQYLEVCTWSFYFIQKAK